MPAARWREPTAMVVSVLWRQTQLLAVRAEDSRSASDASHKVMDELDKVV